MLQYVTSAIVDIKVYCKNKEIFILSIENPMRSSLTTMSYQTRLIKIVRVKKKMKYVNASLEVFQKNAAPNKNLLYQLMIRQ